MADLDQVAGVGEVDVPALRESPSQSASPTGLASSPAAVTRDSVTAIVGGLVSQGFKFLTLVYVARHYSSAEFGMVMFAYAVDAYLVVASNFGLPVFGTREVSKAAHVSSRLLHNVIFSRAVLALLSTCAAVAVLASIHAVDTEEIVLVALFGLSNVFLSGFVDWAFQGLGRQDVSAILNAMWQGLWLAFVVLAVRTGGNIASVPIGMCLAALLASVIGYVWLKRSGSFFNEYRPVVLLRDAWNTLIAGAHIGLGTLLITILVWTDAIIVRLSLGQRAAGLYAAGSRPGNSLVMLCGFYMLGAFPQLTRASADREQFTSCFQRAYDELALIYIPFALWGIFYARDILLLVFQRTEYTATVPVFQIFQVALVVMAINLLYGTGALLSFHEDRAYQTILRNTTFFFLTTCLVLTRLVGMVGTALAIPLASIFSLIMFVGHGRRVVRPAHSQALLPPLLSSAAAVIICRTLSLSLWSAVFVLALTYLGLLGFKARGVILKVASFG